MLVEIVDVVWVGEGWEDDVIVYPSQLFFFPRAFPWSLTRVVS
jgi:hypothetical protein